VAAAVIDYKTGEPPNKKTILEGRALQLLVYAMLLEHRCSPKTIEYWHLPRVGEEGEISQYELNEEIPIDRLTDQLQQALCAMLREETPFLANMGDDRSYQEYDGISRYDEWATCSI